MATTSRARATAASAFNAAVMLMLTWSSLFADVGIVSAPDGCAGVVRSGPTGRAVHLRRSPHRIGVLNLAAELVRLVDAAAVHQALDVGRRDLLSAEGAGRVDAAFERVNGAAQGVDRKSRRDVGSARELFARG